MSAIKGRAPHADADPQRGPAPARESIPEGLRRERKSAYGPTTGRHSERVEPEKTPHADGRQVAGKD
jgi:hypothetical protein